MPYAIVTNWPKLFVQQTNQPKSQNILCHNPIITTRKKMKYEILQVQMHHNNK